uniref:Uncharacterized protein n=1 Tax=Suricata suricatta TaxID=37032 RepID=A0A673TIQ4_SURSU
MYISTLFASLLVPVTDNFFFSVPHSCKTFEDIEKACLGCFLHQPVHLLVVKCSCMVMSFKS